MPRFDGSGPEGLGPMSGRGMGRCNSGNTAAGNQAQSGNRGGGYSRAGRGSGKGMGRGAGNGMARSGGRGSGRRR